RSGSRPVSLACHLRRAPTKATPSRAWPGPASRWGEAAQAESRAASRKDRGRVGFMAPLCAMPAPRGTKCRATAGPGPPGPRYNRRLLSQHPDDPAVTRKLVLLRHGQSQWNLENRFTGWVDVDLTDQGRAEAAAGGRLMREEGLRFDVAYTSTLKRAIRTLNLALGELDQDWIPVHKSWRLNERHYGALQGLDKAETAAKHGEEQVKIWRRSYDIPPPAMD